MSGRACNLVAASWSGPPAPTRRSRRSSPRAAGVVTGSTSRNPWPSPRRVPWARAWSSPGAARMAARFRLTSACPPGVRGPAAGGGGHPRPHRTAASRRRSRAGYPRLRRPAGRAAAGGDAGSPGSVAGGGFHRGHRGGRAAPGGRAGVHGPVRSRRHGHRAGGPAGHPGRRVEHRRAERVHAGVPDGPAGPDR